MSTPVASRKYDFQTLPRAFETDGVEGQAVALDVDTSAIAVDLAAGFSQGAYDGTRGADPKSLTYNYIAIIADVDIGIISGPTLASVSGANAPDISVTGTLSSNVYVGAVGTCFVLPAGFGMKFLAQKGVDQFLGIVGSEAGIVRMYQVSPSNA